jgi:hypothetical protein
MKDPGVPRPKAVLIEGPNAAGVRVGNRFVVFSKGQGPVSDMSFPVPGDGQVEGLVADLPPRSTVYVDVSGGTVRVSTTGFAGKTVSVSAMGIAKVSQIHPAAHNFAPRP